MNQWQSSSDDVYAFGIPVEVPMLPKFYLQMQEQIRFHFQDAEISLRNHHQDGLGYASPMINYGSQIVAEDLSKPRELKSHKLVIYNKSHGSMVCTINENWSSNVIHYLQSIQQLLDQADG